MIKKIALGLMLLGSPVLAANKLPYLTGLYARSTTQEFVIDSDFSTDVKNEFIDSILTYYPQALIQQDPLEDVPDGYIGGKKIFKRNDEFSGISGYAYFAGSSALSIFTRTQNYTSGVALSSNSSKTLIHENGHLAGLGHEDCNYRWIKFKGTWRKTQEYDFGNSLACGIMAYGSSSFTPVDDFDFRRVAGQDIQKGRVKGTITINGEHLKGANLIFISQTKTFKPTWRVLKQRFSTIVDILGDGDSSFEIELPPDSYQVMLVPIGNYDRNTHGAWRLADSQIKDITEPLFLNRKRTRLVQDPATKGIVQITNGVDITFNWSVGL